MSDRANPEVDLANYNPFDPATLQDPFPAYEALRRNAPAFRHELTGMYFISRHATVKRVLGDTDTFSSRMSNAFTAGPKDIDSAIAAELKEVSKKLAPPSDTMLTADPPQQTRYRKAMGRAFTQRVPTFEAAIREIAIELIDSWPADGRVDFMNSFAVPFPVKTIAQMLAMKSGLEADIKRWSDDSVAGLGTQIDDARRLEAARGVLELQTYWTDEVDLRRREPRDDFITDLAQVQFDDPESGKRPLTTSEAISILQQLMVAGNETTTKLINELMKLLAQNPEQWRRLREDPSRVDAVVEEGLRLSTPNQGLFRQVRQDVELEGVSIAKGSTVWVMFASANRDDEVFPDAERFDPDRPNLREHLALGSGAHFCIGAPLARLETKIALLEIAKRVGTMRIADGATLTYEPSFILRGLAELELQIEHV
ncbi:MAG: cytochrome P450 [Myxococcota bacterium]